MVETATSIRQNGRIPNINLQTWGLLPLPLTPNPRHGQQAQSQYQIPHALCTNRVVWDM